MIVNYWSFLILMNMINDDTVMNDWITVCVWCSKVMFLFCFVFEQILLSFLMTRSKLVKAKWKFKFGRKTNYVKKCLGTYLILTFINFFPPKIQLCGQNTAFRPSDCADFLHSPNGWFWSARPCCKRMRADLVWCAVAQRAQWVSLVPFATLGIS